MSELLKTDTTHALAQEVLARVRAVTGASDVVPLHAPEFANTDWQYVKDTIDTGWVSSVGAYVDRFETDLARICGVSNAVAVVNGTAALQVAFTVVGVCPGDEVLMPTLSFVATANAAVHTGATPHFVDVEAQSLGMDPKALLHRLEAVAELRDDGTFNKDTGRRISAMIPMHCFGHPVQMDELQVISENWRIPLVEDAAESLGSLYKGKPCGSLGHVAAVSFNGNKIITTGGGGAVLTNDADMAARAKHLTTTAKVPHKWAFDHDEVGWNYRLPNINAALGVAQLEHLPDRLARKRELAKRYEASFDGMDGALNFVEPSWAHSNYWLNTIVLEEADMQVRDAVLQVLNDNGVIARPVWTPLHRLPMYSAAPRGPLDVADDLAKRIVNVPSSAGLVGDA